MPLSGLRVIDLTRIIAGPFCTQLLADMGAEVIKVEAPGKGDPTRRQGATVDGLSYYFAQFNRNKKSITANLYTDDGKAILAKLIEGADVLVENFRPGVLAKMGFDEERLETLNPALVVGSINGYGSTGPYVDRPAFDFIGQRGVLFFAQELGWDFSMIRKELARDPSVELTALFRVSGQRFVVQGSRQDAARGTAG